MVLTHRTNNEQIAAYTAKRARKIAMAKFNKAATPKPVDRSAMYQIASVTYAVVLASLIGALLASI